MSDPLPWLNRLAHDLRGPLMPLQTASYLLRSGQLDPERQQELFVLVERQTQRLVRMIDELDDWTRASQHTLLGAREACEPALLLDNAIGGARFGSNTTPPVVVDDTGDTWVEGDPSRLTQLLRTLLEYAARSRPVEVRMRIADARVQIDVIDAGATPDATLLSTLLEEPMPEPYDEGLGLRLLVARAIAEAHDGTLQAGAAPGGGLRLRCELPIAVAGQP
jgi:signal transduction histidine kinase